MNNHPPKLPLRFLRWFCDPQLLPYIEGDLIELFEERVETRGIRKAKWFFFWEIVKLFRTGIIRNIEGQLRLNSYGMFKNYFKVARRHLWRNKTISSIQLAGLTLSICVSLIVFFIVEFEFSFDKFHKDADRIYRVNTTIQLGDNHLNLSGLPQAMFSAIRADLSSVELAVPVQIVDGSIKISSLADKEVVFNSKEDVVQTDNSYFQLFEYEWLAGAKPYALTEVNQVVITKSRANKYFPLENLDDILGKTITYGEDDHVVVGIVEDLSDNTEINFKEFRSFTARHISEIKSNEWAVFGTNFQTYVKASKNSVKEDIQKQLSLIEDKYYDAQIREHRSHYLQSLQDIHFNPSRRAVDNQNSLKSTLYGLLILAFSLLIVGSFNYISLCSSQNENRWKEIGVRKTLGSSRKNLVFQLVTETLVLASISGFLAFVLSPFVLNIFEDYLPDIIKQRSVWSFKSFLFAIGISWAIGLIAGIYPAMTASRLQPLGLIKKYQFNGSKTELFARQSFTVMKFMIAQFFIVAVVVVDQQIKFSLRKDLGFDSENVLVLTGPNNTTTSGSHVFLQNLKAIPSVKKVCLSGGSSPLSSESSGVSKFQKGSEELKVYRESKVVDSSYIGFYGIPLLAGSNLHSNGNASKQILINETFTKKLGFQNPTNVIGEKLEDKTIVGVIRDFHTSSTHKPIEAVSIGDNQNPYVTISQFYHIRIDEQYTEEESLPFVIEKIEHAWNEVFPHEPLHYSFIHDDVEAFYKREKELASILKWYVGMTLFISCLGLLGLTMYQINKRVKEVGIRKVLGASTLSIVTLFSKISIKPVVIATVLSFPLTLYGANKWLENFSYTIRIDIWMFAVPAAIMIAIAMLTVIAQVRKVAIANPVESLRDE